MRKIVRILWGLPIFGGGFICGMALISWWEMYQPSMFEGIIYSLMGVFGIVIAISWADILFNNNRPEDIINE